MKTPLPRDHWPDDARLVVDAYRIDQRRELLIAWGVSLAFMYGGGAIASVGWLLGQPGHVHASFLAMGLLAFLAGLAWTVVGLRRSLGHECYVSLRKDGLVVRANEGPWLARWDDLESIEHEVHSDAVRLVFPDGSAVDLDDRYMDVSAQELARRIARAGMRALWSIGFDANGNRTGN